MNFLCEKCLLEDFWFDVPSNVIHNEHLPFEFQSATFDIALINAMQVAIVLN